MCLCRRYTICHKTEVVKNTLDPVWQAFKIPVRALCNGDYDRYETDGGITHTHTRRTSPPYSQIGAIRRKEQSSKGALKQRENKIS